MTSLHELLGFSPEEVHAALGENWEQHDSEKHGAFFIKEADFGPDLVLIGDLFSQTHLRVGVGPAIGQWMNVGELTYDLEPAVMIERAERGSPELLDLLSRHAAHSARMRRGSLRTCMYCGQTTPPEFRIEAGVCQGCATTFMGVVY